MFLNIWLDKKSPMAFRRRFRKFRSGRRYKKRSSGYLGAFKRTLPYLASSVRFLKSVVNAEKKYCDTSVVTVTPNTTGQLVFLNPIATGTDQVTRNGMSVKATSLFVQGSVVKNASATSSIVRLLLVMDHDNQGTAPNVTDILDSANVNSQLNQYNGKRFQILRDKKLVLDTDEVTKIFKYYMKLGMHLKYGGTTSGSGSARDNALYMLLISNEPTNTPSLTYSSRLRFIDN